MCDFVYESTGFECRPDLRVEFGYLFNTSPSRSEDDLLN